MPRAAGDGRFYQLAVIDGTGQPRGRTIELPSVTTILKALPKGGLDWYGYRMGLGEGRVFAAKYPDLSEEEFYEKLKELGRAGDARTPTSVLKSAAGRGTDVHDIAEHLFKQGAMPPKKNVSPEQLPYALGLKKFYDEKCQGLEVVEVEVPVFSLQYQYAGTLDLILKEPDENVYYIIDFKTSKAIYESHLLQTTAYAHACREQGYIPADANVIGMVVRLGDDEYEVKNSNFELADFMNVYRVWQWLESCKA